MLSPKNIALIILRDWFKLPPLQERIDADLEDLGMDGLRPRILKKLATKQEIDQQAAWETLCSKINLENPKPRKLKPWYERPTFRYIGYAAAIMVIGSAIIFFGNSDASKNINEVVTTINKSTPHQILGIDGSEHALMSNQDQELLDKNGQFFASYKNNILTFNKQEHIWGKYRIQVPRGKNLSIILPDGSEVNCYPETELVLKAMDKNHPRRMIALDGRAFFNIKKDSARPFRVLTNNMLTEVLGTSFEINSYPTDVTAHAFLVEGCIEVFFKDGLKKTHLLPNQKIEIDKRTKKITLSTLPQESASFGAQAELSFRNVPFKTILKNLERNFGVTITNKNRALDQRYFNATFTNNDLEEIINSFQKESDFEYRVENNNVIIE